MTWVLVDDDGNERTFDSKTEAQDQQQSMKQLGKDVDILPVDEATGAELQGDGDDVDAEVIEVSDSYGGNRNSDSDDDDEDEPTIVGDGGAPYVFCENCNRLSACTYRCSGCGADLAGEPHYDGELP